MITTRQAAKQLGIGAKTLSNYIAIGKVPAPKIVSFGKFVVHSWTEAEIEHVRQLLPKIANGRKTRYKKKQSALGSQQSAKTKKKAQARAPAVHKKRKPKKK